MSSCLIVYFSQGGTTRAIAEAIAKGLQAEHHEVMLHDLKDGSPPDQSTYDVLGIGGPAHYYRPALIVSDYLDSLPDLGGKSFFSFMLHGAYPGDAGNGVRRLLQAKGGKEMGYAHFFGASYFLGYLKQGYQFSPNHPKPDNIARAESFGHEISDRIAGKAFNTPEEDTSPPMIYRFERFLTGPVFIRHMHSRMFRFSRKKCNSCGLCIKSCPTRNISERPDGSRSWGRNCILCFRCELKCPQEAIGSPLLWLLFRPFLIYNTRREASDPAIEHARVIHEKGRTTVIKAPDRF